jgi:hypothetical protein
MGDRGLCGGERRRRLGQIPSSVPPPALCHSARSGLLRPTNRPFAAAAAAARSDGGTERSGWGSIATSHAPNGQGDGEQRAQAEFWAWYVAWSRRALRRPCAPPSWMSALRFAAGRRLRLTGGTTTFLSSSSSSFFFLCIILFSNRPLLVLALVSPFACVLPTHIYACSSYGSYFMPVRLLNISRESCGPNDSG